jgi:PHD/YefM family antitoxin component YafN of YafNO toxin-antitoxin module
MYIMSIKRLSATYCTSLDEFLAHPLRVVSESGGSAIAILSENKPAFYVAGPEAWDVFQRLRPEQSGQRPAAHPAPALAAAVVAQVAANADPLASPPAAEAIEVRTSVGRKDFRALARQLVDTESHRVDRGELSAASLGILRNRLDAHVLPFFRYIPPAEVNAGLLDDFVLRLSKHDLSSNTISQYLVVVRKLLKLAVRHGLLREVPEMPSVRVVSQPRSMLKLADYAALVRTANRLRRLGVQAPQVKDGGGQRERFWVAPKNLSLAPDMAWVIVFMVNAFVRPGDLRQLQHKHVTVVRGDNLYLRLNLPETKSHDKPIVTLRPAVRVYQAALAHGLANGYGGPDDYVFLPGEANRDYALAVLGFWFKWVLREAGIGTEDELGHQRTLYSLRHTAIMFRLLYGKGIDMLTLARNARTSVQMIERFYASSLSGEMNVQMLQSRRGQRSQSSV